MGHNYIGHDYIGSPRSPSGRRDARHQLLFKHAIIHQAVYQLIPALMCRRLHALVAASLESRPQLYGP